LLNIRQKLLPILLLLAILIVACEDEGQPTPTPTQQEALPVETMPAGVAAESSATPVEESGGQVTQEPTIIPASPTPSEPLAALVNGQPVYLSDYESELARYQQADAELDTPEINYSQAVLDALIERELIRQAAVANGISVTDSEVDARLGELQADSGSAENFQAWLQSNQWTEEEFQKAISAELLTQKMIETITANVPTAAEQIHARYIRVDNPELAQSLVDQVNAGADFAELARQNSLDSLSAQSGGDMGFFSAGSLLVPELEPVAFSLQPGETSEVIPVTNFDGSPTYYILHIIEREAQRPLSDSQRSALLEQTLLAWIEGLTSQAEITIFVDTEA
jgi:parvulin-like peptidyl-prolyl isomerase